MVTLKENSKSVDEQLDEVREQPVVDLGTHVYYAEGSDTPVVPTGELSITFEEAKYVTTKRMKAQPRNIITYESAYGYESPSAWHQNDTLQLFWI